MSTFRRFRSAGGEPREQCIESIPILERVPHRGGRGVHPVFSPGRRRLSRRKALDRDRSVVLHPAEEYAARIALGRILHRDPKEDDVALDFGLSDDGGGSHAGYLSTSFAASFPPRAAKRRSPSPIAMTTTATTIS